MNAFSLIERDQLNYKLTSINLRELVYLTEAPCDFYDLENGLFVPFIPAKTLINKELIRSLMTKQKTILFVFDHEHHKLIDIHQDGLRNITRSLSIGDPVVKARRQLNLLTLNLSYLYENPINDELLALQYQSAKTLANFLMESSNIHERIFHDFQQSQHDYIFAQPMLASLFLIGVLKLSHHFSHKEMETFFITSYFKDIGMSTIPIDKYNANRLSRRDKKIFLQHPKHSSNILSGRIPLSPACLRIIENHHSLSLLNTPKASKSTPHDNDTLAGIESLMITVMDIIAAMTSGRPYREPCKLFHALGHIKNLICQQSPSEFKLIVNYFNKFFRE